MDLTTYLQSKGYSQRTIQSYKARIESYQQWLKTENIAIDQVTANDILAYMKNNREKGQSQKTIQHQLVSLTHYYDHQKQQNDQIKNPVTGIAIKGIKRNSIHHTLQPHQMHQLYHEHPNQTLSEKRNKVMLGMVVNQGLKTEELGKLETNDLQLRAGAITIREGRKNNERTLKLAAHQMLDLYEYTHQVRPEIQIKARKESPRLFISTGGSDNYALMMRELIGTVKKINPGVRSLSQLRASVIVKWLKRYNLREVQYKAGHRYISSTEAYQQNDIEGLKEYINQYHPLG